MGEMERELQWWKGQLAADIHQSLRIKELKLPAYRALSPQIGMRRYFADLLAILSNRYQLCPTARHLAVYLLDLFMDHYDVAIKQLYVIALSCLLLARRRRSLRFSLVTQALASRVRVKRGVIPWRSKSVLEIGEGGRGCCCRGEVVWFMRGVCVDDVVVVAVAAVYRQPEDMREDRVPKLEQLNSLGFMCSLNLVLNKKDLIRMELLLLETFGWNLCMPTPAHFIDYYLHASVQEGDLYNGWPLSSLSKTKAFMDKYTHYFLEVSLQDHAFLSFRPSQPQPTHLSPVSAIQRPLSSLSSSSSSLASTPQPLLYQPDGFPHLAQHSPSLSQLHMLAESRALGSVVSVSQDFLQGHRMGLLTAAPSMTPVGGGGAFPSYAGLTSGLQPGHRALPLQGPISMQMALAAEPRHCLAMAYAGSGVGGGGYLGAHHTFAAGCFDSAVPGPDSSTSSNALSKRRLKRKQRSKGNMDPVEVITLT
ncbi:hypothetical protein CRUP_033048 [Coryphaenoides rupestris]|nr:hypothetical protein CRUP_033048 [Coryphaenoides rupestris]